MNLCTEGKTEKQQNWQVCGHKGHVTKGLSSEGARLSNLAFLTL